MISVYTYLLGGDTCMSHDIGREEVIEAFTEESSALIFVPNKYEENSSSKDDVEGRFLSVRDVCWMDPTTVLYYKQMYNRNLPSNFPKVLSLHYSPDERRKRQIEEIFGNVMVRSTPLIKTLLAMLKFNSSLSVSPEADHVRDFTSITLHLVKECENQASLSESYIYDHLKDARIFPSQNNHVWVTLRECLLENDDPKLAKNFSKSSEIHYLRWPEKLTEKKKGHAKHSGGIEDKERFMKYCRITKLKDKVCSQIDYSSMVTLMEGLKEKLSLWVPLIQKFIYLNCRSQYDSLIQDDIVEKLKRLQVLCVPELKCLYYIEHDGKRIISPEPSQSRACELDVGVSGIPTIYVSEKKKDKPPVYLRGPLTKLFMGGSNEASFQDFVNDLLSEVPSDEEEVRDFAEMCELHEGILGGDEEPWTVPLPVRYQNIKERSSEEDTEDEGYVVESVDDGAAHKEVKEEGKPLTSWPPKSAADPSDSLRKKHVTDPSNSTNKRTTSEADVIGEDDLKEMRRKHFEQESSGTPEDSNHSNQAVHHRTDDASSMQHGDAHHSQHSGGTAHSGVAKDLKETNSERMGQHHHRNNYPTTWNAMRSARQEAPDEALVDIQHLIHQSNQEGEGEEAVIPLMEITNCDDQDSLAKIGRWGEEYVYQVLRRRGELPSSKKIKNISWVNQETETGKPYDIEVELAVVEDDEEEEDERLGDGGKDNRLYIEVKSTVAENKDLVSLSWNELKFAEKRSDYHLYRVYSAGKSSSRLCYLENLHQYLKDSPVRLMFLL